MGGAQTKNERFDTMTKKAVLKMQEETNFDHVNVQDMWKTFKSRASTDGEKQIISKTAFADGCRVLEKSGLKKLSESYINELYDRLDTSRDGQVELFELVSGLSLMCAGSADEKLGVFFDLYDRDGDGSLSKDEIELLINTAVENGFRATLHRNDKAVGSPQSTQEQLTEQLADELAKALAQQLAAPFLSMLDKDGNGRITLDEFRAAKDQMQVSTKLNGLTRVVYLVDRKL